MSGSEDTDDGWLEQFLADLEAAQREKKLKDEHQWVLVLIRVLLPRGSRGLRRPDVIERVAERRKGAGLPMPKKIEETIQSSYNRYSRDSKIFKSSGRPIGEALFYSPGGKGSGIWAVEVDAAALWVKERHKEI